MRIFLAMAWTVISLAFAAGQGPNTDSANTDITDARFFPPTTIVYAQLSDPVELISVIFDHPLREKIESLEPYQMATQSPGYKKFLLSRAVVEGRLQMSWREALETLATNRVSVGFDADTQGLAVIFHGKDTQSMTLIHDQLRQFAKMGEDGDAVREGEYRGLQAYRIKQAHFAVYGDRIIVTNDSKMGQKMIDRLIDGGDSLADNPRFRNAWDASESGAAGWGFIDVQSIRQAKVADAAFHSQINNPVLEVLVGGIQSTLKETSLATATLTADRGGACLRLTMPFQTEWIPPHREYYFGPSALGRGPALPRTSETLLTLSTYRDFSQMWLRAGDLYNAQINDGFAKADANLTTLFAGRDFGEDILGSLQSEVGLIARRQQFGGVLPRPTIKLPAFAVIFELKEPEVMTRELRRIFQSLVGFLNVIGAMEGRRQLEMEMEKVGDQAELVMSSYVPEEDERESTAAKIVFNFSPSIGFSGKRFVVSSSKELARDLTLAPKPIPDRIDDNTQANLQASVLRDVLADNREQLIAQNMLEDGHTREEAEAIIDLLLQIVGYFHEASLRLGTSDDQLQAELQVRVRS